MSGLRRHAFAGTRKAEVTFLLGHPAYVGYCRCGAATYIEESRRCARDVIRRHAKRVYAGEEIWHAALDTRPTL